MARPAAPLCRSAPWLGSLKPSRTLVPDGMLPRFAVPLLLGPTPLLTVDHCAPKHMLVRQMRQLCARIISVRATDLGKESPPLDASSPYNV